MQRYLQSPSKGEGAQSTAVGSSLSIEAQDGVTLGNEDDDDDDEEVLRLKLQAIEARLRLKRARSRKIHEEYCKTQGTTSHSAEKEHRNFLCKSPSDPFRSCVDVPRSPIKHPTDDSEKPRQSPSRLLLGIDKGLAGRDVLLNRPPSALFRWDVKSPSGTAVPDLSTSAAKRPRTFGSKNQNPTVAVKSFNARVNERRQSEQELQESSRRLSELAARRENRSSGFGISEAQLAEYKLATVLDDRGMAKIVPTNHTFSHDQIVKGVQDHKSGDAPCRNLGNRRHEYQNSIQASLPTGEVNGPGHGMRSSETSPELLEDISVFDPFSATPLSTRTLPHVVLAKSLKEKVVVDIPSLLRQVKNPDWAIPEKLVPEGDDFVVFGIVGHKSEPLDHKDTHKSIDRDSNVLKTSQELAADSWRNENRKYMVLTLVAPDLRWSVQLFLFTTAYSRWRGLKPGTLVAILNPGIMPPPPGRTDTNRWSLKIGNSEDTVLEVGTSRDLAWCQAIKQDGRACGQWVNGRRFKICEFHLARNVEKARGARMETQGAGFSGGPSSIKAKSGSRGIKRGFDAYSDREDTSNGEFGAKKNFDRHANSAYYLRTIGGSQRQSTAVMLDTENMMQNRASGSHADRTRKLLAEREKEMEIARKLGSRGNGAGAEYMRLHSASRKLQGRNRTHNTNDAYTSSSRPQLSGQIRASPTDASKIELVPYRKITKNSRLAPEINSKATCTDRLKHSTEGYTEEIESDGLEII